MQERRGRRFCSACAGYLDQRQSDRWAAAAAADESVGAAVVPSTTPLPESPEHYVLDPGEAAVVPGRADPFSSPVTEALFLRPSLSGNSAAPEERLGRGILWGVGAGAAAVLIWCGMAITTGLKLGAVASLIGAAVGAATGAGAARRSPRLGLVAIVLSLGAILVAEYALSSRFPGAGGAPAGSEYEEMLRDIGRDGRYTRDELTRFYAFGEDSAYQSEFARLDRDEIQGIRAWAHDEYLRVTENPSARASHRPAAGEFVDSVLRFRTFMYLALGCGAAYLLAGRRALL